MITSEHLCCSYYVLNQVINLRRDLRVRISITDSKLWLVPFYKYAVVGPDTVFYQFLSIMLNQEHKVINNSLTE